MDFIDQQKHNPKNENTILVTRRRSPAFFHVTFPRRYRITAGIISFKPPFGQVILLSPMGHLGRARSSRALLQKT